MRTFISRVKVKETSSRGRYKIGVDEDVASLVPELKSLGYSVWTPEKGTPDSKVNKQLNELGVRFFITANYKDFRDIPGINYFVIGVQKNHEAVGLARIIMRFLMKEGSTSKPGNSKVLNTNYVNENLRK